MLQDSTLMQRKIGRSPLKIVATPNYLARFGVPHSYEALQQHHILGFAGKTYLNHWPVTSEENLRKNIEEPTSLSFPWLPVSPTIRAENGEILKQLCLNHLGIGCFSHFMIEEDIRQGRLTVLCQDHMMVQNAREEIHALFFRSAHYNPIYSIPLKVKIFLDFFQSRFRL